jgi:hypothetical protein
MNTNITPREACAMIEAATGEQFTPRRLITWARNRTGEFPPLSTDAHSRLLRFEAASIAAWIAKTFGGDKEQGRK